MPLRANIIATSPLSCMKSTATKTRLLRCGLERGTSLGTAWLHFTFLYLTKHASAGADVGVAGGQARGPESSDDMDVRRFYTDAFTNGNLNITHVFFNHRRPLFVALNGPVIGMTAALVAYGDFIYATPQTYLLTPFASLGLAPEGGSSVTFPLKMGAGLANRALILSERISCAELAQSGFVTKIFERQGMEDAVFKHIESVMEDKNIDSMRIAKEHIQDGIRARIESANVKEVYGAIDRFSEGIPQLQFLRLASREKKHKL